MVAKVEEKIERKAKNESLTCMRKDTNKDEDEVVKDANTSKHNAQGKKSHDKYQRYRRVI